MNNKKICKKCLSEKNINEFSLNWKYIKNICKSCINEYSKKIYIKNIDLIKIIHNEYYINNKDNILKKQKEWYYNNKHNVILKKNIRKRRIEKVSDWTVTYNNINIKLDLQNNKCIYCKSILIEKHLDHIHPISKWWLHTIWNVHWTCPSCNLRKWTKSHNEFLTIINNGK